MLNLGRRDGSLDTKTAQKLPLGPAPYGATGVATRLGTAARSSSPPAIPTLDRPVSPATPARDASALAADLVETAGSKLSVGPNIKLKGVEISDCAILIVEGHMEAAVNSTVMEIAKPGTLKGVALIDVAEIHGDFSGELTARKKLVVHGTGRVSGTIRYGTLIVIEGGELTGDVKRLDASMDPGQASAACAHHARVGPRLQVSDTEVPATRIIAGHKREAMEENCATAAACRPNRAERAATDLVIKALAMKAYPDDIAHPYRLASKVCASLELEGARISRETVAQKLKAAFSATVHAVFIPRIE